MCQHGHVLNHVKLGGVHGLHLVLLHHPCLSEDGDTSEGPQSPPNTPCPKTCRLEGQCHAGDNLVPSACCHPDRAALRFGVTGPGEPQQHPVTKPSWDKQAQLVPCSGRGALAEPDRGDTRLFPHNVLDTPILCSSSQLKSPRQCSQEILGYLGKQLKPVPHHLKLDLFNPTRPSTGKISRYVSGLDGRSWI